MTHLAPRKVVYFFCDDLAHDHVGPRILDAFLAQCTVEPTDAIFDGKPVVVARDERGNEFHVVRTRDVLSHDYKSYLPDMNRLFHDFDFGAIVNWHEGQSAPDNIFCVHSTAEPKAGAFGPADGQLMRALLLAVEDERSSGGPAEFRTMAESTHWSGVPYGGDPALVPAFPVPLVDVEIGSSPSAWENPVAARTIARALLRLFEFEETTAPRVLMLGGMHIASSWAEAVLEPTGPRPAPVHVLGNQWIAEYEGAAGLEKLRSAALSSRGGLDAIVFHDKLKGSYKDLARSLAAELGVPAVNHKKLTKPDALQVSG